MTEATLITSRDNPLLKELRKLADENTAYRKAGRFWIEGDHLCSAALLRGLKPAIFVVSESFMPLAQVEYAQAAIKTIVISDTLFRDISGLESPAKLGFVLDLPEESSITPDVATVILDRVQDAGNVGSSLRRAGAFGFVDGKYGGQHFVFDLDQLHGCVGNFGCFGNDSGDTVANVAEFLVEHASVIG